MNALLLLLAALQPQEEGPPTIRVLIQDGATAITIECRGALDLKKPGVSKPLLQFAKVTPTPVTLVDNKFKILDKTFDEPWLTFEVKQDPLKLGARAYPGQVHLVRENSRFKVVNEIDVETYVLGVVGAEIGSGAPVEAMKVQAVCARSYVASGMEGWPRSPQNRPVWDVHDDTRSQVYVGVPARNVNVESAVRDTASIMVMYKGKVVRTYFSSSCGGHTIGVREWGGGTEIPPLSGVPCGHCTGAPNGTWSKKFTLAELSAKFKNRTGGKPVTRLIVKEVSASKRPETLILEFAGSKAQLSSKEVRDALGLSTAMYAIRQEGETVTIDGAGYGHGVGLCQVGALNMAAKGKKAADILNHYFPQAQLLPGYEVRKNGRSGKK